MPAFDGCRQVIFKLVVVFGKHTRALLVQRRGNVEMRECGNIYGERTHLVTRPSGSANCFGFHLEKSSLRFIRLEVLLIKLAVNTGWNSGTSLFIDDVNKSQEGDFSFVVSKEKSVRRVGKNVRNDYKDRLLLPGQASS